MAPNLLAEVPELRLTREQDRLAISGVCPSTKSVQLERSERAFEYLSVANRAAKSTT